MIIRGHRGAKSAGTADKSLFCILDLSAPPCLTVSVSWLMCSAELAGPANLRRVVDAFYEPWEC